MKRRLLISLLFLYILLFPMGSSALQTEYSAAAIDSIQCTNGLNFDYLPTAVLDDNPRTYWRTDNSAPLETGLIITLTRPAKILGLALKFAEAQFAELEIEYYDARGWHDFTRLYNYEPTNIRQWQNIDLSYDEVTTSKLRLHFYAKRGYSYIGSIADLKINGYEDTYQKNLPITKVESAGGVNLFEPENLCDNNTASVWEASPDQSGTASVILNFPTVKAAYLKLYMVSELKGVLAVEYRKGDEWVTVEGLEWLTATDLKNGWNVLPLSEFVSDRLRLTFRNQKDNRLGGISEIQVWGESSANCDKAVYNTGISHLGLGKTENEAAFRLNIPALNNTSKYYLLLTINGQFLDGLELNGFKIQPGTAVDSYNSASCYKIPVTDFLTVGDNFIKFQAYHFLEIIEAKIEEVKNTGMLQFDERYPDDIFIRFRNPFPSEERYELDFRAYVHLMSLQLFSTKELNPVRVQIDNGYKWQEIDTEQFSSGFFRRIRIPGGVTVRRLRLLLPYREKLDDIVCWGSVINVPPPLAGATSGDEPIAGLRQSMAEVTGIVDRTNIGSMVNEKGFIQDGGVSTAGIPSLFSDVIPANELQNEADGQNNGKALKESGICFGEPPQITLDQNKAEYYTRQKTFVVSGTVNQYRELILVNNNPVRSCNGKFSCRAELSVGKNIITVIAHSHQGISAPKKIIVYCDPAAPKITVKSPLPNQLAGVRKFEVSGWVADLTPVKVSVNGTDATVDGAGFKADINLALGINTITVAATDKLGNSASVTVKVECRDLQPKLAVSYPLSGRILKSGRLTLTGTVIDKRPVKVTVNGQLATRNGTKFQIELDLEEGPQVLRTRAVNDLGYEAAVDVDVVIDISPPEDFTIKVNPSGWTNNKRPVITFATVDKISGIDHYELKIDAGEYVTVSSPYQCESLADGEHSLTVKAVDRAGWETLSAAVIYVDTTPPDAVSGFKTVAGAAKIITSWEKSSDSDLQYYLMERVPAFADGKGKKFNPEITGFVDETVENLESYQYTIQAVDRAGNLSPVTQSPLIKAGVTETEADPDAETKLEYENVIVGIPKGALPEEKTITIMEVKKAATVAEKAPGLMVSPIYSLSATSKQGLTDPAGVRFEKPVLVGIHFTLDDVLKQYLKKSALRAFYYNYQSDNWEVIPESYVDPDKDIVYFLTYHFSMFSVQASATPAMAPEQVSNMGVSPGKAYYQNNEVNISYGSGSAAVLAKDFVLPGRGGLDLTISRSYDSTTAQGDWGVEEQNICSALFGFINANPWLSVLKDLIAKQIDSYLAKPAGSYGFGRGWRMNFVWVEKDDNGQFVHLPGGGMKKISWTMDGSGWGGLGHGVFECHAGEHFILEQTQEKQGDLFSDEDSSVKVGEQWQATGYTLTTKEGTKYYLNGGGKLLRVVNRLGNSEIKFVYQSDGKKLDYIVDSVGRKIQFAYSGKFIRTISGGGKTVTYDYNNDELVNVNDGVQETKYDYQKHSLKSGSQTVSLVSIITNILTQNWVGLIASLLPFGREDSVYYLSQVTTPFKGEYQIQYSEFNAYRYIEGDLGYSIMWYEFGKVTGFKEVGSAYTKEMTFDYRIHYEDDKPPTIMTCNIYEGAKRTEMYFTRFSNGIDKDLNLLKAQLVYGENDRELSSHLVEYDRDLEAPVKVTDQTGGRTVVQEYQYDNWGNLTWQKNSQTGAEAYYTYANTGASAITHSKALASPYNNQALPSEIHDLKTGELILNKKESGGGAQIIPQQVWYQYAANGNLSAKAVRHGSARLETGYQYDAVGNITKMTSPAGVETFFEYSDAYQKALLTKVTLGKLTDAAGVIRRNVVLRELGYEPETFRKRWEKDARGYATEYRYDLIGREVMTVLPDDNDPTAFQPTVISGAIDRSGARSDNPVQQVIYKDGERTATVIDPLGNRTNYLYDAFEHLVEIIKYKKILGIFAAYSRVEVRYDDQGNISEIVSPMGVADPAREYMYKTRYLYDEMNRLKKITYPDDTEDIEDNPIKYYEYNEISNTVTVTDENGNMTIMKKDGVDRVIEQTAGLGSPVAATGHFSYDALGNKVSETDGRGNTTWFVYDDQNRLTEKIFPETAVLNNPTGEPESKSSRIQYSYDAEGNLTEETTPLGSKITHTYDEMNREIMTKVEFTGLGGTKKISLTRTYYDLAGNKLKVVDANGKATQFTYSARGWLLTQTDPLGGVTSYTYDLVGNKLSETDPRGNASGAPANSYTAWYFYDELYRVVKAVLPDRTPPNDPSNPGDNPVVGFEYDLNGNCVKETKANGQVINYSYNGRNWLLTESQALNGKTYTTRFEYDGVGNKRFAHDNKDNRTEFRYDALNRLDIQCFPEGNVTEYDYDLSGNKIAVRDGKHNETKFVYDALNRLIQTTDAEGKTSYSYYNEDGKLTKLVSATNLATIFRLNELGLPLEVVDSLGNSRVFDYDPAGNVIYKKDPRGTEATFTYDDLYRVLRTDLRNGARSQFLTYEYDAVGNIKKAGNGQVELVYNGGGEFDPFNRIEKVEQAMPDGTRYATAYRYDNQTGQMTGIRYPNSAAWLDYEYDLMGRVIAIPGFAGTKTNPGFSYDENSALASLTTDNGVTTAYQRDKNGRVTGINATAVGGGAVLSLNYAYDAANNIIQRNDNTYVYDKVNRLLQATVRGSFAERFTKAEMLLGTVDRDYQGTKDAEEDVTDLTEVKLDYAARSLIINLQTEAENIAKLELTPVQTGHRVPVGQLEIYYRDGVTFTKLDRSKWSGVKDAAGMITIKFNPLLTVKEIKIHCNYDDLDFTQAPVDRAEFSNTPDKLVTVYQKVTARTETYGYDAMGNRTSEKIFLRKEYGWEYTYYPDSNQLKAKAKTDGSEKFEYAYDANGNLVSKVVTEGNTVDTWEYVYDLWNRMEQVKKNGEVVSTYVYDPNGFRVEKIGGKGKIHYVPLLNGEVGYRKEFSGNAEYSFIYVGIQHLARVNGVIGGSGKKFYYQNDHLGSALAITDENGNKVVERDFAPFGERIDLSDSDASNSAETGDGFTGKDWDEDVGLYYYNARWYDPEIGRFVSEDSVADDPNLYGYCGGNPVNNIDPTGNFSIGIVNTPLAVMGAMLNAAALLTGDQNLAVISSAFSLFVAIDYHNQVKEAEKIQELAKSGQKFEEGRAVSVQEKSMECSNSVVNTNNNTEEVRSSQQTTGAETSTMATTTASSSTSSNVQKAKTAEKPKETKRRVISKESEKQLKELSKVDPSAKEVYDEVTGPVGVNLTIIEGEITYDVRGLEITIKTTQEVNLTKGTITVTFGPDGKISSITDVRGHKVDFVKEGFVKLTVGLIQPTEISFGKNSAFTFTTEFSGEMNWNGRIMIYSTTIACKPTGQAIKVSVGLNIDARPPAPQKVPNGIPFAPPPVVPIPLPI